MKGQSNRRNVPGVQKGSEVKLLLVAREDEFKEDVAYGIFGSQRHWSSGRAASLLGALERIRSEAVDLVLLSHEFRDPEVGLFIADARREGFSGFILRVVSPQRPGFGHSGGLPSAGQSINELSEIPFHALQRTVAAHRRNKGWDAAVSFTARQREVLACVSQGWTNQQVALHLKCTEGSVKATLQQLFEKLEVRKRAQLVRVVMETSLFDHKEKSIQSARPKKQLDGALPLPVGLQAQESVHLGDFVIDLKMLRVWVRGVETHLTPSEFQLLAVFAMHPGELMRNSALCEIFWRNPTARYDALRVLVRGLRSKIEAAKIPQYIVTERYLGYRFIPSPTRSGAAETVAPQPIDPPPQF